MKRKAMFIILFIGLPAFWGCEKGPENESSDFPYAMTRGIYSEKDDIFAIAKEEFGSSATVADWEEIKRLYKDDIEMFVEKIGLIGYGKSVMVTRKGKRFSKGKRHYFMILHEGQLPRHYTFYTYDNIRGHYVDLGSWFDLAMPILCKIKSED